MDILEFQEIIGIEFQNPELLKVALTHRSHVNEHVEEDIEDNERMEYLGDAVLDFLTADMLYRRFPNMPEGEMTRLRAALVRTEALAQLASECRIGEALVMGKGEVNTGGRERLSNLCAGFEALIGAIYLDQGLDTVKNFVIPRLTELQKDVMEEAIRKDPRSQFQEIIQASHSITPLYQLVSSSGPEHDKQFTVQVSVGDFVVTQGQGRSKRAAAQAAAAAALKLLQERSIDIPQPSLPEETDDVSTVEVQSQ